MHPIIEEFSNKIKNEILENVTDSLDALAKEREDIEANIKVNKQNLEKFRKQILDLTAEQKVLETERTATLAAGKSPMVIVQKIRETKNAIEDLGEMVESIEGEVLPTLREAKKNKSFSMGRVINNAAQGIKDRYVSRMEELIEKEIEPFLLGWKYGLGQAHGAYQATQGDTIRLTSINIKSRVIKNHVGGFGMQEPSIYQI